MNNLTKSVLIVNRLLDLLMGTRFTTPTYQILEDYPDARYFS